MQRNKSPAPLQQSVQSDLNVVAPPPSNVSRNPSEQQKSAFPNATTLQSSNQFNSSNTAPMPNQFPPSHFGQPPLPNSAGSNPTHQISNQLGQAPSQLGQPLNKFQQNSNQLGQPPRPQSNSGLQKPPLPNQILDDPRQNTIGSVKASTNGDNGQLQQSTGNFYDLSQVRYLSFVTIDL